MESKLGAYAPPASPRALSLSTRLVGTYAERSDANVMAEVAAILDEVGEDRTELHNLVGSLAGLAGHAVRTIAIHLEADFGLEGASDGALPRLSEQRTKVLAACADALIVGAAARDRRSGVDRRLGIDRRQSTPGDPREQINLRLFGERRVGPADRRNGIDRRSTDRGGLAVTRAGSEFSVASLAADARRPRLGVRAQVGRGSRPRP
jgi:hypothetical protein